MTNITKRSRSSFSLIVYHVDQDIWTFSFWEGDRMSAKHVEASYEHLRKSFFAADRIAFRPDSPHHEDVAKQLGDVPVITNDSIYKMATYQTFNPGESVGLLRIVRTRIWKNSATTPTRLSFSRRSFRISRLFRALSQSNFRRLCRMSLSEHEPGMFHISA